MNCWGLCALGFLVGYWVSGSIASPEHPHGVPGPIAHPCVSREMGGRGSGSRLLLELIAVVKGVLFPSLKPSRERWVRF